jgi:hypothetical protein
MIKKATQNTFAMFGSAVKKIDFGRIDCLKLI